MTYNFYFCDLCNSPLKEAHENILYYENLNFTICNKCASKIQAFIIENFKGWEKDKIIPYGFNGSFSIDKIPETTGKEIKYYKLEKNK